MKKGSNISKILKDGNQEDEFIVKLDFYYCDVTYEGFLILNRCEISELLEALDGERELYTPNMPGDWCEDFDISLLKDAFTIHSSGKEDIAAMRLVFGDAVGNTELYDQIAEDVEEGYVDEDAEEPIALNHITLEIAEQFLENCYSVWLDEATLIDDDAAEALSKHEGELSLNGLTEISDAAAQALSKHKGELISLNGLTELSDATGEALSKHEGALSLDGLTELSNATAEALSKHEAELYLGGITRLSDAAAEALSKHEAELYLDGLTELSDAAAVALSKNEGESRELNGLTKLSDAAAEALSKHKGELCLNGLTELSDATAEALSKHEGSLYLGGITKLSGAAAEALSKLEGEICRMAPAEWLASLRED